MQRACRSQPGGRRLAPKGGQPRERVLSDSELAEIWKACGDDDHGRCIKLLILTGCRRQEVGGIAWSEFDFERGVWTLPAARSKNGRAHTLPLLPTMLPSSRRCRRWRAAISCSAQRANGFTGWSRGKAALDACSRVKNWTTHDIREGRNPHGRSRHAAAHHRADPKPPSGHKRGVAASTIDRAYEREVRAALALWQDHVRTLVEGGERKIIPYAPHAAT